MATLSSIADGEATVRSLVAADLAALPASFGPPAGYRPTLIRFYCDQVAQQMATDTFAAAPSDIATVAQATVQRMLTEELLRRVTS